MSNNMEPKKDENPLDFGEPGTSTETSVPMEKHNLKIRRRNVIVESKEAKTSNSKNGIHLAKLSDSTRAWYDNVIPRIPEIADISPSGKQNGVLNHEDDSSSVEQNFPDTETLTNRERMKISVIRASIVNPNLTLGELKLLGCSSEGLVNGISSIPVVHYYQQGTSARAKSIVACLCTLR